MNIRQVVAASAVVLAACAGFSQANAAQVLEFYNTGVDSSGTPLALGAQDTHYVVNGPGAYTGNPYVYYNTAYIAPGANAGWVAVQADGDYPDPQGSAGNDIFYTETLTFSLAGYDASTAALSGFYASDNSASVYLNGNLLSALPYEGSYANFQSLTAFGASSADFVAGTNQLVFHVSDWGPPSALLVSDLSVTAGAVPEPATWAMFLIGFGSIGFTMRQSRRKGAAVTA